MAELIAVEVVYPRPDAQPLLKLQLPVHSTVADALNHAAVRATFGDAACDTARIGIFAKHVERSQVLRDGDRVELYRPLTADPKTARRQRAAKKAMKTNA